MKKNLIVAIVVFMAAVFSVAAQVSVDPGDRFYTEAQSWQIKGLVPVLPQIRPYPVNVIKKILQTVVQSGSSHDAELAADEYARIFSKPYTVELEGTVAYKTEYDIDSNDKSQTRQLAGEPDIAGDIQFHPLVSLGYRLGIFGTNTSESNMLPYYTNSAHDAVQDPSTVGPFNAYVDMNTLIAVGTDKVYATAGVSRVGFGPFLNEGIALNDSAYHAANFTFNVNYGKLSYCQLYESIGATTNLGSDLSGNKFLALHSIAYQLTKKLNFSYYETIVFGRRAEPSYLFPAPYMVTQGINGCNDNLQMGLLFEYIPIASLKWATDIFVDDISFNDIVKLNFDTKIRIAAQTGFQYAPFDSPCTLMNVSYMVITPYTYSHWEYDDYYEKKIYGGNYNYQNYTNNGVCMGASIPPDSDRILFSAKFNPAKSLEFNVSSSFARHQNVCEALGSDDVEQYILSDADTYSTDGSVYTQTMFSGGEHVDGAWNRLNFMTGDHTMYVCSTGFSAQYMFPRIRIGQLSLKAGYTFEYVQNEGVQNTLYRGGTVTGSGSAWHYSGDAATTYATQSEAAAASAAAQKAAWIANLHNVINQYISVSVKFTY